jgi:hypothetical protein
MIGGEMVDRLAVGVDNGANLDAAELALGSTRTSSALIRQVPRVQTLERRSSWQARTH